MLYLRVIFTIIFCTHLKNEILNKIWPVFMAYPHSAALAPKVSLLVLVLIKSADDYFLLTAVSGLTLKCLLVAGHHIRASRSITRKFEMFHILSPN